MEPGSVKDEFQAGLCPGWGEGVIGSSCGGNLQSIGPPDVPARNGRSKWQLLCASVSGEPEEAGSLSSEQQCFFLHFTVGSPKGLLPGALQIAVAVQSALL